jgi:hypothetical protein
MCGHIAQETRILQVDKVDKKRPLRISVADPGCLINCLSQISDLDFSIQDPDPQHGIDNELKNF